MDRFLIIGCVVRIHAGTPIHTGIPINAGVPINYGIPHASTMQEVVVEDEDVDVDVKAEEVDYKDEDVDVPMPIDNTRNSCDIYDQVYICIWPSSTPYVCCRLFLCVSNRMQCRFMLMFGTNSVSNHKRLI